MTRIAVLGGTGFAGRHIVTEAISRGHSVLSISRSIPAERVEGAIYLEGSILDLPGLLDQLEGVDVVVSAISPRGEMEGKLRPALDQFITVVPEGVRLGVVAGAGAARVAEGGPRLVDTAEFPEDYKPEALELAGVVDDFEADDSDTDWFIVHPAAGFGSHTPGERTGHYREGGEVLVVDDEGNSFISGADLAVAVLDEIEHPKHHRARFTVGY